MPDLAYVVILNWNGRDYIRDCLKSVLQQSYPRYRILVVDNCSTDGSREIIAGEFSEVKLVPLPDNLHFARGTNAGIREALKDPECTHILTLNNDTRVDPEWLTELMRVAADVGMVASKLLLMDQPHIINSTGLTIAPDGSALDRGWNLVQNYPWRYAALTVPWNSARVLAGPLPWDGGREPASSRIQNPVFETARAMARARVDAYAGIPRALAKRRARAAASRVSPATVGGWLRRYHVSFRDAVLA